MSDDYIFEGETPAEAPRDNNPPLSISELSFALKRTLEDRFGHVRLRGEISKVNRHASGHVYLTLKDDKSALDGVVWKGSVRGLGVQPETGLEVIVTGKITSYPARSSYQIVIESMEAAGAGAFLAQLERLKTKLRDEGLFEPARKTPIPAFPTTIGVITSPTGAVIRDILHRIADRWPSRVIVWPVVVQGDAAAGQVANAIRGFDALPDSQNGESSGPIPRPDLLIVARGGGSVEDLWCFNDEALARTVAAARIPIISAVGHETDTTLIDFVSDRRAPTPTGAAEIATPVLSELRFAVTDLDQRLNRAGARLLSDRRTRLMAVARGLPARPDDLTALAQQRLDHAASRLGAALHRSAAVHERRLAGLNGRFGRGLLDRALERRGDRLSAASARLAPPLERRLERAREQLAILKGRSGPDLLTRTLAPRRDRLDAFATRLIPPMRRRLDHAEDRLNGLARALSSLNPLTPKPGFARIDDQNGNMIASAASLAPGQAVRIVFPDGSQGARIDSPDDLEIPVVAKPAKSRPRPPSTEQGDLF